MNSIRIHHATRDDLAELQSLCVSVYSEVFGSHWNDGGLEWYNERVYGAEQLTKDLTSPNIVYSILYLDETPVAFMKLKLSSSLGGANRKDTLELQKLYVAPAAKARGLGKQLMELALSKARELGKKTVRLEVLDTNYPAISFYRMFGFETISKTRLDIPYFKDELRGMLIMEHVL
jgi:ribosomal protein S18 acetylase RimI-like enzyme